MTPVTVIPTALAQRAAAANPRNAATCGIFDIAGRLGQAHKAQGYIIRTIDGLIAAEDFPVPFPVVRAGGVVKSAHKDSRWPIVAIDAWFDDRLPPAARGMVDQAERVRVDSTLASRAMLMFSGDAA